MGPIRLVIMILTILIQAQKSLCSVSFPSEPYLMKAKKIVLNYLSLDNTFLNLVEATNNIDKEFLCALELLKFNRIDSEIQKKLIEFKPKSWNSKEFLQQVYSKIAELVDTTILANEIQLLVSLKGNNPPKIVKILKAIYLRELSDLEVKFIAEMLTSLPFFVTLKFLEEANNEISNLNMFKIVNTLSHGHLLGASAKLIQAYVKLNLQCNEPRVEFPKSLACVNILQKPQVISVDDFLIATSLAHEQKLETILKNYLTDKEDFNCLIRNIAMKSPLQGEKCLKALYSYVLPNNLSVKLTLSNYKNAFKNFKKLQNSEKITLLLNLKDHINNDLSSILTKVIISESNPDVCFTASKFYSNLLLPIQGKLTKPCSKILISLLTCSDVKEIYKLLNFKELMLLLPNQCLIQLENFTIPFPRKFLRFLIQKDLLEKIETCKVNITNFSLDTFIPFTAPASTKTIINLLDRDLAYYLFSISQDETLLKVVNIDDNLLEANSIENLISLSPFLSKIYHPKLILEFVRNKILTSNSPVESKEILKFLIQYLCVTKYSDSNLQEFLTELENQVKNFRTFAQIVGVRYLLIHDQALKKKIILYPFREDIEELMLSWCEKN